MCKDKGKLECMLNYLKTTFKVVVEDANVYARLHITCDRNNKMICIAHQRLTDTMLTEYVLKDANPISTPSDVHVQLSDSRPNNDKVQLEFMYQEIIGSLMYLAICSRTRLLVLCQKFSNKLHEIQITTLKLILKYLRGTKNYVVE